MSWQTIRPQVKTLLDGISTVREVSGTPKLKFNNYPAAYVVPSENQSEYETSQANERVYAFIVRLFYETKSTTVDTAMDRLEDVVDTVLDTLDKEDLKSSTNRTVGVSLPSGYTFLSINAHPSTWGELPGANLLMAEIRVSVKLSIDINST